MIARYSFHCATSGFETTKIVENGIIKHSNLEREI